MVLQFGILAACGAQSTTNDGVTSSVVMCKTQPYVFWLATRLTWEWGDGEFRSDMTEKVGRYCAVVHGCNDADELGELVYVVASAPRLNM